MTRAQGLTKNTDSTNILFSKMKLDQVVLKVCEKVDAETKRRKIEVEMFWVRKRYLKVFTACCHVKERGPWKNSILR